MLPHLIAGITLAQHPTSLERYTGLSCNATDEPSATYLIEGPCTPLIDTAPEIACVYSKGLPVIKWKTTPKPLFYALPPALFNFVTSLATVEGLQENPQKTEELFKIIQNNRANLPYEIVFDFVTEGRVNYTLTLANELDICFPTETGDDPPSCAGLDALEKNAGIFTAYSLGGYLFECGSCIQVASDMFQGPGAAGGLNFSHQLTCGPDEETEPIAAYVGLAMVGLIIFQYISIFLFHAPWAPQTADLEKYYASGIALAGAGIAFACACASLILVVIVSLEEANEGILNYTLLQTFAGLQAGYFFIQLAFLPLLARENLAALRWVLRISAALQIAALGVAIAMAVEPDAPGEIYAIVGLTAFAALWVTIYDSFIYINTTVSTSATANGMDPTTVSLLRL